MEQDFVIILRRQLGPAPSARHQGGPVHGVKGSSDERTLYVTLEKALLVIIKELIAIQPVRERSETASRYPGDYVDLIEQTDLVAGAADNFDTSQRL